ncbi:integral membrane protein [Colletotrichum plurivorum]|uniref:Integral membrane protein n=1 Tax=Colletotrichum plurivorum TaxID=2175906 RepID=A0A8H6N790_9PEZI|nr:integral membrane protein [Colletotrichum plurivorum]
MAGNQQLPQGVPPAGNVPMPEFNQLQRTSIGFNVAFIIFIVVVMGIRLYARLGITKSFGADDVVMVAGTIATIGMSICVIISVTHGLGLIMADIPPLSWKPMLLSFWVSRVFYAVALMTVKIGLLLFYLRLDHRPRMRWAVYGLMALVIGMGIAHIIISIIECMPPSVFWTSAGNFQIFSQHCMPPATQQAFWDAAGVIVVITDVCLWLCPMPMIWTLQLPTRQKIAVSAVFALGVVSVAAACTRFYYVRKLANEKEIYQQFAESLIWYSLEIYMAIVCGCSSAFKVFFKKHFPLLLGSFGSRVKSRYALGSNGKNGTGRMAASSYPLQSMSSRHTGRRGTVTAADSYKGVELPTRAASANGSEDGIVPGHRAAVEWDVEKR